MVFNELEFYVCVQFIRVSINSFEFFSVFYLIYEVFLYNFIELSISLY